MTVGVGPSVAIAARGSVLVLTGSLRSWRSRQALVRKDGQVLELLDTRVTFPAGSVSEYGEVLSVIDLLPDGSVGFVTDVSPFHPVNDAWPDQGPDRGSVLIDGVPTEVVGVVLGATQGPNLFTAANIPVRRGEPGWAFVVVHVLAPGSPVPVVGQRVELRVDAVHRGALSLGHTACHLAALALNAALEDRWRKPVPLDGLGHPDFDQQALAVSRIHPDGATDVYRLGKSLRKRGFDWTDLPVDAVVSRADQALAGWVERGATVRIDTEGPGLSDRRSWVCALPEGQVRIPCGGTHVTSLAEVAAIEIGLTLIDSELTMETKVTRRRPRNPA